MEMNNNIFFEKLYNETFDDISKYVICNCSNISDVNDIIQNIYLDVFKIINKNNYDLLNKKYIFGIARNKLNDYYRNSYNKKFISSFSQKEYTDDFKDDKIDVEKSFFLKYDSDKVWNYLRKNTLIAKIFYLYFYYGLTIVEISKSLNISESSVKNYLYRTLKKLNKYMKEDEK